MRPAVQAFEPYSSGTATPLSYYGNLIGDKLFGRTFLPRPTGTQDIGDLFMQHDRELAQANLGSNLFSKHPIMQRLGLSDNPIVKGLGYLMAAPNSGLSAKLSPVLGGDISKATSNMIYGSPEAQQGTMLELGRMMHQKRAEEKLKGGAGDHKPDRVFLSKELLKGVMHESEHTKNKSMAKEIAKDHLTENKHYYTALNKANIE